MCAFNLSINEEKQVPELANAMCNFYHLNQGIKATYHLSEFTCRKYFSLLQCWSVLYKLGSFCFEFLPYADELLLC